MSNFLTSEYVAVRCDLTVDDVQESSVQQVHRGIWERHPDARALVEKELRLAVASKIVEKLAPPVFEVSTDALRAEAPISRAEALRLAGAHTKALAELCLRLETAGENYAVMDARRAVEAARSLVAKLAGDEGRPPVRPGEEPTT